MNIKKIGLIALLVILGAGFFYFDLGKYLTLTSLKNNQAFLLEFYNHHRFVTVAFFIVIYIAQTALSLPGAAILSLAGGAVFGAVMGAIYVNLGATIGATLAFLVARYLFHDAIETKYGSRLGKMNKELEARGINYLLFLRLVPVFPFFLINLGAGLTRMPLRSFIIGTVIGIIPGSFVYCNAGASLATINSLGEIGSIRVFGSFALLGLFALVPAVYQKFRKRQ